LQEEISGWKEDLFTARKSALNLLGVISMSKVVSNGQSFPAISCQISSYVFLEICRAPQGDPGIILHFHQSVKKVTRAKERITV